MYYNLQGKNICDRNSKQLNKHNIKKHDFELLLKLKERGKEQKGKLTVGPEHC